MILVFHHKRANALDELLVYFKIAINYNNMVLGKMSKINIVLFSELQLMAKTHSFMIFLINFLS